MQRLIIEGGTRVSGEIAVHGAKNSALPLLAATLLGKTPTVLHNCPKLSDVFAASRILTYLGCKCTRENDSVIVDTTNLTHFEVSDELMREMRSSIVFLGAILGRLGRCRLSFPGGCELGPRPIDLHISALRQMGAVIKEEYGVLDCSVPKELKGATISLSFPSVGATENIILAAVLAKGDTVIRNAAREPEIVDLANFLNTCGAKIRGYGESTIYITGVDEIYGCDYTVMPDRIVAATYIGAAAITNGELCINNICEKDLESVIPIYEEMGCSLYAYKNKLFINAARPLKSVKTIRTMPYPGFPTDVQAIIMACLCKAKGTSVIVETIFENRYKHVGELMRMGADIKVEGKVAIVQGVDQLYGAQVCATDLRGGAALVLAGLSAEGQTIIDDTRHIDRGYESIEKNFGLIGASIKRE